MKKTGLFLMIFILLITLFPIVSVSAESTELEVTWNLGYVGSMGNALGNENALGSLGSANTSYRHTDVVCIEKAGTTVWFTEKGSSSSSFCSRTGYSISSWKEVNGTYVVDTEGANYPGTDGETAGIAERSGNTLTYTYTTSKDNEYLRFCFCITDDKDASGNVIFPTVYSVYSGQPGTFAEQCEADSTEVTFNTDNTVTGFNWFDGYVGSEYNDAFYVNEIRPYYTTYSYTGIITVPKAGTTISFTDNVFPFADNTVYTISSWREAGETWALDTASASFTGTDQTIITDSNGLSTYSYTTEKDNEHIRLCLRTDGTGTLPTVYWDAPEGTYNVTEATEETTLAEAVPATIIVSPSTNNTQTDNIVSSDKNFTEISLLCFTGTAYFVGFMIVKHPHNKKSGKNENKK